LQGEFVTPGSIGSHDFSGGAGQNVLIGNYLSYALPFAALAHPQWVIEHK
jgi:hypothetical protein